MEAFWIRSLQDCGPRSKTRDNLEHSVVRLRETCELRRVEVGADMDPYFDWDLVDIVDSHRG